MSKTDIAYGVLDLDGEAFHSAHVLKDEAERASFGLGSVVPLIYLTEWERSKLSQHASANALTYMGHHARGGLFPNETEEMERWKALAEKLSGPAPIETSGNVED